MLTKCDRFWLVNYASNHRPKVIGLYYGCHYQRVNSAPSTSDYYSQLIRSAIGSAKIIPKEQITDLAQEQINRKERIKRVCGEWTKSGWYQENVLPKGNFLISVCVYFKQGTCG